MVVATQNPVEMDGTYPLPEAQRDRFTIRISVGYPDPAAELAMLDEHAATEPLDHMRSVTDVRTLRAMITSGAVDMPTALAPSRMAIWISATVSNEGPEYQR